MRTKILLTAAAAMAAGIVASSAQVYSANVVGYVSVTLTNGYNLIANPLDLDGTGTNNTVQSAFGTQLPNATVLGFSGGVFSSPASYTSKGGWAGATNSVNPSLAPGKGVFVSIGGPATVTFVGNVEQGSLSSTYPPGYNVIASQVPITGLLQHQLNFQPPGNVTVLTFKNGVGYNPPSSYTTKSGWGGAGEPTLSPAQAVVLNSGVSATWSTNFTVQ